MNKRGIILFLILCLIILPFLNAAEVTGNTITGKVSNQKTNISVFVLPAEPLLRIDTPTEGSSYNEADNILLSYTAILIDTLWYNLNNRENITINSSLNFTADAGTYTLYLYGNQSNGTILSDNVSFSVSAAPLPPAPPTGGGRVSVKKSFTVNTEEIIIKLKQGETTKREIIILNDGVESLSFVLEENPRISKFLKISNRNFELKSGEAEILVVDFLVKEDTPPDFYLGKLIVKANGIEKEVLIAIEVITKGPLFDIRIALPERFKKSMPGDEIFYNIEIFNLATINRPIDVFVEHKLFDINGEEILSDSESLAIMTRVGYVKEIKIPEYVSYGRYILYARVTYAEETASSSVWFNVEKKPFFTLDNILLGMGAILGIIILIIILRKLGKIKTKFPKLKRKNNYSKSKAVKRIKKLKKSKK